MALEEFKKTYNSKSAKLNVTFFIENFYNTNRRETDFLSILQDTDVCRGQLEIILSEILLEQSNFINFAILVSILVKIGKKINIDNERLVENLKMAVEEKVSHLEQNIKIVRVIMDVVILILDNIEENNWSLSETDQFSVDIAQIFLLCFEFFVARQKSISLPQNATLDIIHVFKNTTTAHSKFLVIMDRKFVVNDNNEVYNDVLDIIVQIGHVLLDLNVKLMAENWKGFIMLAKKTLDSQSYNFSKAIKSVVLDIHNNFKIINKRTNSEKMSTSLKATGFLVKLILKLFELVELNMAEQFEDILLFVLTIYSTTHAAGNKDEIEFYSAISGTTETFIYQLLQNRQFLQIFFKLEHITLLFDCYFGFLNLANEVIGLLPNLLINSISLSHENIIDLVRLIFQASSLCYKEFFEDSDCELYENLVINVSLISLLFPSMFPEIEKFLFEYITCGRTWTRLIASDVWYLVLKNSTADFRRASFNSLLSKMLGLNSGTVYCTATSVIYLKILLQRLWKLLLPKYAMDELSKYSPSSNISVWTYINVKDIPMSHRYYIEFILSDLYPNANIMQRNESSFEEVTAVMESLDIISNANLRELEINTSKLSTFLEGFWLTVPQAGNNKFWEYVVYKLAKVTISLKSELSEETIYQATKQMKRASNQLVSKLVVCDLLAEILKRNFQFFKEKKDLRATTEELIKNIFNSSSAVVIQAAVEVFNKIAQSKFCSTFCKEMMDFFISQHYNRYFQKNSSFNYNIKCLESDYNAVLKHHCKWNNTEPTVKKMRMEEGKWAPAEQRIKKNVENVDCLINDLKKSSEQLIETVIKSDLNTRQLADVQNVLNNLTCFI